MACTRADRAGLAPVDSVPRCVEQALGDAVRAGNKPLLTKAYLSTHTLQQAASHGIEVPAQLAAK